MVDATRALLDELMGRDRNMPNEYRQGKSIAFDDPDVCKHQLAGLCPNRLFKNTKSDLGACQYTIHDDHIEWDNIKEDFAKEGRHAFERYERKLMAYLEELIREMDRKIVKCKERAEKESQPRAPRPEDQLRLDELKARAKEALDVSQQAGESGDVDASMRLAQQAEELKQAHDKLLRTVTAPDKTMQVCDVCGVFINSTDNEQRRLDHIMGKQYLGWKAIREKHAELKAKLDNPAAASGRGAEHERAPRSRSHDDGRRSERDRRPEQRERRPEGRDRRVDERERRPEGRDRRQDERGHERERSPWREDPRAMYPPPGRERGPYGAPGAYGAPGPYGGADAYHGSYRGPPSGGRHPYDRPYNEYDRRR